MVHQCRFKSNLARLRQAFWTMKPLGQGFRVRVNKVLYRGYMENMEKKMATTN